MKKIIENEIRKCYKDSNFTVQKLAENLNISQSYLREVIQEHFRTCPKDLIELVRLNESIPLLLRDMNIYNIAIKVGYRHSRAYRWAFKKRFDISPLNFREKYKNKTHKELETLSKNYFRYKTKGVDFHR